MSTTHYEGTYDLLDVNVALGFGVNLVAPLLPQIDLALFGAFGLGPLALDFEARLDAALSITIVEPSIWITGQLKAMADLAAGIAAGAVLPGIVANLDVGVAADLQAKLFGINALIDATIGLKLPVFNALGDLEGAASAKVGYLVWDGTTSEFNTEVPGKLQVLAAGNGGGSGQVYIIALMFGSAATFSAAASMFLSPHSPGWF